MEGVQQHEDAGDLKAKGIERFQAGDLSAALQCFQTALQRAAEADCRLRSTLHSNIAAVHAAREDCASSLQVRAHWCTLELG